MGHEYRLEEFKARARNTDIRGESGESEDHVIGKWRKDKPYCKVTKNLEEKYFSVLWKAEFANKEIKFLAK